MGEAGARRVEHSHLRCEFFYPRAFWVKAQGCPCLSARQLPCPCALSIAFYVTKKFIFCMSGPHAKLQGCEDKQGNSYLEGPYNEVPACLIK